MADRLRLRIYTPEREVADVEVREVTAPGALGEIGVLPDHAALVTALDAGPLSYRAQDGSTVRLQITGGFAEVRENVMTVIADGVDSAAI